MPKRKDPEFNTEEYYELLSELFPSEYIEEKKTKSKKKNRRLSMMIHIYKI